jgi:diaminopimelate epimerase
LQLVKHHGLGNDFLVAFPDESCDELPEAALAELAVRLCDRRTGVGADGLLIGLDDARADVRMVLFNADGSRAEMSGNGIRCFAHAFAARRGDHSRLRVSTDAGLRTVEMMPTEDPATWLATVDMGEVTEIDEPSGWATLGADPNRPVAHLSLGNPHAVVPVDDVLAVDLLTLGSKIPHVNLEIVEAGPGPSAITMRVHERGAGITQACGTGACAAAVAAWRWGLAALADGKLTVHMDGGSASVGFVANGDPHAPARVTLTGPTTYVATIEYPNP